MSSFATNFILGGLIIATVRSAINNYSGAWGGFVYGAIPVTYIYLYLSTALDEDLMTRKTFAKTTAYSVLSWIVFVLVTYWCADWGTVPALIAAVIVFAFSLYVQYKWASNFGIEL
jgi:hypothetical protein